MRRKWSRSRGAARMAVLVVCALVIVLPLLGGCSPGYVVRAAYEEARFLWGREPIDAALARSSPGSEERAKLELVVAARRFADEKLGLRVGGSYGAVSNVDGRAIVHVLTAARRDRLKAVTWWFPVVGSVPYKGFFSLDDAKAEERVLQEHGNDTYLRPAMAFSTLGWFDDPVPSTLLKRSKAALAETIFHELFHNTLFVPSQVAFNESAANFIGHRAAIEFFCSTPETADDCSAAGDAWADALVFSRFLADVVADLEDFYRSTPGPSALEAGRTRIFKAARERFATLELRTKAYGGFTTEAVNNASLLHDWSYFRDLDVFEELYRSRGRTRAAVAALEEATARGGDPFARLQAAVGAVRPELVAR